MTFPPKAFLPAANIVTSITRANPGVVTTSTAHGYANGLYARLIIPIADGMQQLNGNVYLISVTGPNTFSIDQDTTNYDVFSDVSLQKAEVIPVGETANTLENAQRNSRNIIPEIYS